ncbi:hypothetical protein [Rhodococcus qingshengii]|uniref:hypothetical protein n=1 Tax=Rhodococcus qingshengii TaxID=334542 RepID=UPI001C8C741D|nr:hypothetical protein [Rhodococcus qingshengii]MBX9147973.1 hypothetical protein [Rhodococcus qingshengii]
MALVRTFGRSTAQKQRDSSGTTKYARTTDAIADLNSKIEACETSARAFIDEHLYNDAERVLEEARVFLGARNLLFQERFDDRYC